MDTCQPMPAPDDDFEELYYLIVEPSLAKVAPLFEAQLNMFSEVRNVRIGRVGEHEELGWIVRYHAPTGENEAHWQKAMSRKVMTP